MPQVKKVKLERISSEELRMAIRKSYEDDAEMRSIHILNGASLDEMVDYTWHQNVDDLGKAALKFYKVVADGIMIGHTTLLLEPEKILFTFGINIHYRKKEILLSWLKAVDRHLGHKYILTIREGNERALRFFERNGFGSQYQPDQKQYVLWRLQQSSQQSASQ